MSYRLLACDIDNTLVRFPDPPSPRVVEAVQAATRAGVTVVLVTGRAFRRARPVAEALGLRTPMVCNHGGSIRDTVTGAIIHREVLPQTRMREIVAWLQTQQVHILVFDGDMVYHDGTEDEIVPDFQVYTRGEQSVYAPDLLSVLPPETEVILSTTHDHDHLARVYERAVARFGHDERILFSHPYGLDIMPKSSKSSALAWLAEVLHVTRDRVIAVGDGDNDVDMLAWAGLGVAIGDGTPDALAAADTIAPPFDQDGLAWTIERYILSD
jgi:Cof subfamily protein (haloacid dehalogenase superfamily)